MQAKTQSGSADSIFRGKENRMRILAIADNEEKALWDFFDKERLGEIDLIISCGDLHAEYLEFLRTMLNAELLYVRGNHDSAYEEHPPEGCVCIEDRIFNFHGLRIMGLGGSMRSREGRDMYTERQMATRVRKLRPMADMMNGFDMLITHAPAKGYGDLEDHAHQGFAVFNDLMDRYHPRYLLHGHVHKEYARFSREREHPSGAKIINCCGYVILEVGKEEYPAQGKTGSLLYDLVTNIRNR